MLRQITARQFQEWRAYADLEPFDEERADLRAADIVRTFLNVHRRKGAPPLRIEDVVLRFGDQTAESAEQARTEIENAMGLLMVIFNSAEPKKKAGK